VKRSDGTKLPVRKAGLFALGIGVLWTKLALAQPAAAAAAPSHVQRLLWGLLDSAVYTVLGMLLLVVCYKLFAVVVPFDLNKELSEDDNPAVGVFMAGVFVAVGLVIAAAIGG